MRLPRLVVELLSPEVQKPCKCWHLGTWFGGGFVNVGLMVELNSLRDLLQTKLFYNFIVV